MNFLHFHHGQGPSFLDLLIHPGKLLQNPQAVIRLFCGCLGDVFFLLCQPSASVPSSLSAVPPPSWVSAHSPLTHTALRAASRGLASPTLQSFTPLLTSEKAGDAHELTSENPTPGCACPCWSGPPFSFHFVKGSTILDWSFFTVMPKATKVPELKVCSIILQSTALGLTSLPHSHLSWEKCQARRCFQD